MPSNYKNRNSKRFYTICIAVTLLAVLLLVGVFFHLRAQVAPVLTLTVEGLKAETPAEAQAMCRADSNSYAKYMKNRDGCSWVWCGEDVLYLVRPEALHIDAKAENVGFPAVTFKDEHGASFSGYIIDPTGAPNEIGRIRIDIADEYNYDNVSMSVRVALRNGEISYDGAVYLWEKGSSEVFAARADSYTVIDGNLVSFVDDGGVTRVCYILDTKLD